MNYRQQRKALLLRYHPDKNYGNTEQFFKMKEAYPYLFKTSFMYSFDQMLDQRGIDFNDISFLKNQT